MTQFRDPVEGEAVSEDVLLHHGGGHALEDVQIFRPEQQWARRCERVEEDARKDRSGADVGGRDQAVLRLLRPGQKRLPRL